MVTNTTLNDVMNTALGYLARREYSIFEMQQKLLEKYEEALVAECMATLIQKNFISDERFAEAMLRYRLNKGYGPLYLRKVLREKRVNSDLIETLMQSHAADFSSCLLTLIQKKCRLPFESPKEKVKGIRFLASRGFSESEIYRTLKNSEHNNE
jgi:regulatory protein